MVAAAFSAATMSAIALRPPRNTPDKPAEVEGLAFVGMSAPWGTSGILKIHRELGMEFRAGAFGTDQVAVALDRETYWFWMRSYEPRRYHFCPLEDVSRVGLNPLFSPLFIRCASGAEFLWRDHPEDGDVRLSEGSTSLATSFRGGRMSKIVCSSDGGNSVRVEVLTHQRAGDKWIPRRMKASLNEGEAIEMDMGEVEINPLEKPDARPPSGMKGARLKVRN